MTEKTRRWLAVYAIVAHALAALLYWQNSTLRAALADSERAFAVQPEVLCATDCRYQDVMLGHLVSAFENDSRTLHLLGDSLVAQMPEDAMGEPASNLGIGGDSATGVAFRVSRYPFIAERHRVVIHVGINDILQGRQAHTAAAVRATLAHLKQRGVRVVLSAVLPVNEAVSGRQVNASVSALNAQLRALCHEFDGCEFADASQAVADANGQLRADLRSGDGIHLTTRGYHVLAQTLRDVLGRI